jgi:Na+/proline symporter
MASYLVLVSCSHLAWSVNHTTHTSGLSTNFAKVFTTWVLRRYNNELQTSEMFSTAGRTVKSGLVASAVVSSWTWAATLLQSSSVAFRYGMCYCNVCHARKSLQLQGVSGPLWYAAGATVQILLFATVAIELKRRAPNAHVSMWLLCRVWALTK